MRKCWALLCSLALAVSGVPVRAQVVGGESFESVLARLAKDLPQAPFSLDCELIPMPFKSELVLKRRIVCRNGIHWAREADNDAKPLSNAEMKALYDDFAVKTASAGLPQAQGPEPEGIELGFSPTLHSLSPDLAWDGGQGRGPFERPLTQEKKQDLKKRGRGPRLHGWWFGSEQDRDLEIGEVDADDDLSEDRWGDGSKGGLGNLIDVDVSLRLREDSLGARLKWPYLGFVENLHLSGKVYTDVPDLVGLGDARDNLYDFISRDPRHDLQGFQVGLGIDLNEHWSFDLAHDDKTQTRDDEFSDAVEDRFWATYRPLGRNPGKNWNYDLFGGLTYRNETKDDLTDDEGPEHRDGIGWAAGVAFRQSLKSLPGFWGQDAEAKSHDLFWLDNYRIKLSAGESGLSDLATKLGVELTIFSTKHIKWRFEPHVSYYPTGAAEDHPDVEFGISTGISFRF